MFLIAAGIALQFAIYVVLLVLFSQYFVYFYWICVLVSLVMALYRDDLGVMAHLLFSVAAAAGAAGFCCLQDKCRERANVL